MSWRERLPTELIPTPIPVDSKKKSVEIEEYRRRFRSRKIEFAIKFGGWLSGVLWRAIRGHKDEREDAKRLRLLFESLGALWIKLGQLISLRSDVLSPAMCEELARLQFRSVGFPWFQAKRIMEEDLGRPVTQVFASIEPTPMAAASICQVHRARLRGSGFEVIVKVQRPYVEQDMTRDMQILELFLGIFKTLHIMSFLRWDSLIWELRQILLEEVDYRYEASNQRRMRKMLRPQRVYVPRLIDDLCSKRVLVMEYVPGGLMSDYLELYRSDPAKLAAWLEENNIDPKRTGIRLFRSFFRQLMEENFFHADLHPGNILLLRDSRFCLIDFGSAGSVERNLLRIYTMSLMALAEQDFRRAVDYTLLMCEELPPVGIDEAKVEMIRSYREWSARSALRGVDYHDKSIAAAGAASGQVMGKYKIAASWQFLKVSRTWVTMDASLSYLIDDSNFISMIKSYFRDRNKRMKRSKGKPAVESVVNGLSEVFLLEGENLRRQMQRLGDVTSTAAAVIAMVLTGVRYLVALAILIQTAYLILEQLFKIRIPALGLRLFEGFEDRWSLGAMGWLLVLIVMTLLWFRIGRIVRGLLTKEAA
jgi:ubiquinone biosynthesis protein